MKCYDLAGYIASHRISKLYSTYRYDYHITSLPYQRDLALNFCTLRTMANVLAKESLSNWVAHMPPAFLILNFVLSPSPVSFWLPMISLTLVSLRCSIGSLSKNCHFNTDQIFFIFAHAAFLSHGRVISSYAV